MSDTEQNVRIATNQYAVRVTGNGFQGILQMPGAQPPAVVPLGDVARIMGDQFRIDVDHIVRRIQDADVSAPLMAIDEETKRVTLIVPGPGMAYNILPWADHLNEQRRAQERQAQMHAAAQGAAGPTLRMPPRNGRRGGR